MKKIRLWPRVSGTLGLKHAHGNLNEPCTGQAMVPLDASSFLLQISPLFFTGDSSRCLVSTFSLLANIDDRDNWECTKLGFPIGSPQIMGVLPEQDQRIFGIKESRAVHLDVSDQVSWNLVICMAQKVTGEPTKFLTLLHEAKRITVKERQVRWRGPKPAKGGPDPNLALIDINYGGDLGTDFNLNLNHSIDLVIHTVHNDLGQTNEGY